MSRASSTACSSHSAARLLEASLLFNFLIHAVAMVSMVLLLMSAMPGGGVADDAQRVGYIADHPWLWRLGWLPGR
jgi:hypothetical protein